MLRLTLTNFRSFENKVIEFPYEKGIVLLDGVSGKGKTSTFSAILYAITGKVKNVVTFGQKHCFVQLEYNNNGEMIIIQRGKGPSVFSVKYNEKTYEKDEAQEVVDKIFGKHFNTISYIEQNPENSFVFMNPVDKMEFLENMLLKEHNIDKLKEKVKNAIVLTTSEIQYESGSYDTIERLIGSFEKHDLKHETFSILNYLLLEEKLKSNIDKVEKKTKKMIEQRKIVEQEKQEALKQMEIQRKIQTLENEKKEISVTAEQIEQLEMMIVEYRQNREYLKKLDNYNRYKERKEFIDKEMVFLEVGCCTLDEINKKIMLVQRELVRLKKYNMLLSQYNDLGTETVDTQTQRVNRVKMIVKSIRNKENLKKYEEIKAQYDLLVSKTDEVEQQKRIERIKEVEMMIREKECLICPKCQSLLKLDQNNCLLEQHVKMSHSGVYTLSELQTELKLLQKAVKTFEKNVNDRDHFKNDLDHLVFMEDDEVKDINELEIEIKNLNKEIILYEKNLEDQQRIKKELDDSIVTNKSLHELSLQLENFQKAKDLLNDSLLESLSEFSKIPLKLTESDRVLSKEQYIISMETLGSMKNQMDRLLGIEKMIETIAKDCKYDQRTMEEIDELLVEQNKEEEKLTSKLRFYKNELESLKKWELLKKENEKREEMEEKMKESKKKTDMSVVRLRSLNKLKEHIKTAEAKGVSEFIDSLNLHAAAYFEYFFPDQDIQVELKPMKKETKVSLNFEVNYKNMTNCDLSVLSGGEKDRVNLAYTLAFSELVQNRILMLDECISSLDQTNCQNVIDCLKEKYNGLVLVVCHQTIQGAFTSVLNL